MIIIIICMLHVFQSPVVSHNIKPTTGSPRLGVQGALTYLSKAWDMDMAMEIPGI